MFALKRNFARRKSGGFIEFPAAERTHSPHTHTRTQTQAHINKQAHREAGRHLKALIMPQWQWPPSLEPSGNLARILKESLREIHKLQSKTERERGGVVEWEQERGHYNDDVLCYPREIRTLKYLVVNLHIASERAKQTGQSQLNEGRRTWQLTRIIAL